ncbi:MAG: four helix bundle protein [Catalinimonas sp.]
MHRFKELRVWERSIDLAEAVYQTTQTFPVEERYGLTSQLRRASVSVASNIAEGAGRNSNKEFAHFLGIASGSCAELETQLIIATRLDFIDGIKLHALQTHINEVSNMLYRLKDSLRA